MAGKTDVEEIGAVEFGNWRLVPLDSCNWELCHRHATADNAKTRKSGTAGKVKWHRLGMYFQWSTIGSALAYAADAELKEGCQEQSVTLRQASEIWEHTLKEFLERASGTVRNC